MRLASNRIELSLNLAIVAAALTVVVLFLLPYLAKQRGLNRPVPVPEIVVGSQISLPGKNWSQSKRTVVFALSTNCGFCNESTEFYRQLLATISDKPEMGTLALYPETLAEVEQYSKKHQIPIADTRQVSLPSLGIRATPTLLLVDHSGTVLNMWHGQLEPEKEIEILEGLVTDDPLLISPVKKLKPPMDPKELNSLMTAGEKLVILDIRSRAAFETGHLPNAKSIPIDEMGVRAEDELSRNSLIVLYADCSNCAGTNKTLVLQSKLDALGFTRVTRLQDGLNGWRQAGFEIVKD
jgi:rhodanese-related sulfurtransferase